MWRPLPTYRKDVYPVETNTKGRFFVTEIEVADQTFHLTQSQYTDTGPTSPSTDPISPGVWQGSHWSANFWSHWYDSTPEISRRKRDSNPGSSALEADALTTRPTRRSWRVEATAMSAGRLASNGLHLLCLSQHETSGSLWDVGVDPLSSNLDRQRNVLSFACHVKQNQSTARMLVHALRNTGLTCKEAALFQLPPPPPPPTCPLRTHPPAYPPCLPAMRLGSRWRGGGGEGVVQLATHLHLSVSVYKFCWFGVRVAASACIESGSKERYTVPIKQSPKDTPLLAPSPSQCISSLKWLSVQTLSTNEMRTSSTHKATFVPQERILVA